MVSFVVIFFFFFGFALQARTRCVNRSSCCFLYIWNKDTCRAYQKIFHRRVLILKSTGETLPVEIFVSTFLMLNNGSMLVPSSPHKARESSKQRNKKKIKIIQSKKKKYNHQYISHHIRNNGC